ncbi:MAG: preprotein translocase subunit Sec61beta [Candidatus Aenigmarchaeota archaeon]|nr:preprotein translocase subunit Sec61beta [Candidatus Aenigmarchaeota archaeon]
MPQSTAGLMRYFDTEKEVIKLKPEHVILIGIMFIVIVMFFRFII